MMDQWVTRILQFTVSTGQTAANEEHSLNFPDRGGPVYIAVANSTGQALILDWRASSSDVKGGFFAVGDTDITHSNPGNGAASWYPPVPGGLLTLHLGAAAGADETIYVMVGYRLGAASGGTALDANF
jgi:hypothetical protein